MTAILPPLIINLDKILKITIIRQPAFLQAGLHFILPAVRSRILSTVKNGTDRMRRSYIIRYSLLFLGISVLVFSPFLLYRRSFVNRVDGMPQYVVYLRYMGQYLRLCIQHILHGDFALPVYDFSIGMGDDIGQIVRFHPLDFLSVFVPSRYTETLYGLILLIRFYLAGLMFSAYAFCWNTVSLRGEEKAGEKISYVNVLSGSLVYVFCGFMLIRVLNHPIYAAPFIVLPMLLLGAEKVMHRRGCALFVFSVFLGFWSNYYFMYIMSAALFVYMLVRYFDVVQPAGIRSFLALFVKTAGLYCLGLGMSMMTLLPTMYRYFSSARQVHSSETHNLLFYSDKRRYIAWFLNLISPYRSSGNGTDLNFAVIVFPCIVVLFALGARRYRTLKKFLILDLVMLLVPFFGFVLAVFNNENNRWMFLIALSLGMTVVFTADRFASLTKRELCAMLISAAVFLVMVVLRTAVGGTDVFHIAAGLQLILCTGTLLICFRRKASVTAVRRVVLLITAVSVVWNGYMTYAPGFGAVVKDYVAAGSVMSRYDRFWRSRGASMISDDSFFRVEGFGVKHGRENSSEYSDYNSTSEYNSILNANLLDAMLQINNIGQDAVTILKGLDARPVSMNLAHVRYFIVRKNDLGSIPCGYSDVPVAEKGKVQVYENLIPLAFGCSYDSFITHENFDALDPLQKEMVQLEAAVLPAVSDGENDAAEELRSAGLKEITGPSCTILREDAALPEEGEGFTYRNGEIRTGKKSAIEIHYEKKKGYDTYLVLESLRTDAQAASLTVSGENFSTQTLIRGSNQVYNIGRENYLFHMGYAKEDLDCRAELEFAEGRYDLSSAAVLYVPMDGYEERIEALNEEPLLDEEVADGRVTGHVSFSGPRMLMLSVPASDGWELKVDGVRTELTAVNLMYQGVYLEGGDHEIELVYRTPGQKAGRCIAIPAIAAWIILAALERKRRKGKRGTGTDA